jgi:hypothetical protein
MEIHRILGDKVRLYRRKEGGAWHASTYLKCTPPLRAALRS